MKRARRYTPLSGAVKLALAEIGVGNQPQNSGENRYFAEIDDADIPSPADAVRTRRPRLRAPD